MSTPDHYSRLGLHRRCTPDQIREAYRRMTRLFHPDVNPDSPTAVEQMTAVNLAYEVLGDPERRSVYDRELGEREAAGRSVRTRADRRPSIPLVQDVPLGIEELLAGTTRDVSVRDPGNPDGPETYRLVVPPETAPGTKFRIPRVGSAAGSVVVLKVTVRPGFRFKARGSDLRCDLRISSSRAEQGGVEFVQGADGTRHRLTIPRGIARGAELRIEGGGLPRARGGRGDLRVRITYRVEVRVSRPVRNC
ncbi:MAG: J domain-containing protein [Verrucomicrobiales bacterium]|nr:J domain-containing protein [Verrucomicrobiales bacterium]